MKKELTPRKRQALEMRAKIQSTALSLFNQEGFENVSVEEIAQAAGCAPHSGRAFRGSISNATS